MKRWPLYIIPAIGAGASFWFVSKLPKDSLAWIAKLLPEDPLFFNLLFCAGLTIAWGLAEYVYDLGEPLEPETQEGDQ